MFLDYLIYDIFFDEYKNSLPSKPVSNSNNLTGIKSNSDESDSDESDNDESDNDYALNDADINDNIEENVINNNMYIHNDNNWK